MFLYEQRAGECGKEELLVHKKTPPAEPGSATHMIGWECGKREQRSAQKVKRAKLGLGKHTYSLLWKSHCVSFLFLFFQKECTKSE